MYNFKQQSYPDQACSVPMTYAYSSSQRYQRLQDHQGLHPTIARWPWSKSTTSVTPDTSAESQDQSKSEDASKASDKGKDSERSYTRFALLVVELGAFLTIGIATIFLWATRGSTIQPMHYVTDLVPSTVVGAVSIFVEDENAWNETDTSTGRHLYSVPYSEHTRVLGGSHNMWFWLLHTSLLTCSFIVLELFMPMQRLESWTDVQNYLKNPRKYTKLSNEGSKGSSSEDEYSRSLAVVLFWNLGLGWLGAGLIVTIIPACSVPINSFFLVTVMYLSWTSCILWFYPDKKVEAIAQKIKQHLPKIPKIFASRDAGVCVATCTSSSTGSARVFGSAIRRPAYLMKAELQTDRHGQVAWQEQDPQKMKGEMETRVFDALSFKFIEYTITAGIFLVGTIMVMGGNLQDVYVVQEALWGMALCNAIGIVLVQEVCREVIRALNYDSIKPVPGWTGLLKSAFFWRTTGLFFASCACFLAAFLPLMLQNLIPVAWQYPVPPLPWQIMLVAHTLMVIYFAFAALGWVFLWVVPCWNYAWRRQMQDENFAANCTTAAQWGIVAFSFLNLLGKSLIAGFTLAGVWAMSP